jgi:hypothetical protein
VTLVALFSHQRPTRKTGKKRLKRLKPKKFQDSFTNLLLQNKSTST